MLLFLVCVVVSGLIMLALTCLWCWLVCFVVGLSCLYCWSLRVVDFSITCRSVSIYVVVGLSCCFRERSGSVERCLTGDRGAAGSSLTSVTAL